jgi:hypothetical protein
VLSAFAGPRPFGAQACHNNGCKTDNRFSNLRWDSASANQADRETHGTGRRGKSHTAIQLTRAEVKLIRALAGQFNYSAIGRLIGRPRTTVADIINRRPWRDNKGGRRK